ncbi:MAG TPA: hypothetical protein PLF16_01210, partial [Candidatus Staskawiczbacteria bacterium]|nr:hypothetical protein [Candidatus Staskawiczbacteria bacterium]
SGLPSALGYLRKDALPIVHEAAKLFKALQFRGQLIVLNVLHFQYSKPKTNVNSPGRKFIPGRIL